MLMGWGPFRFTVPNYSVESLRRSTQPRVEEQGIIGATPTLHRLGPGNDKITLSSTFHPRHLNGRGLAQLAGVRQAVNSLAPLPLVHINGAGQNVFGMWIATSLEDEQTIFDTIGTPQTVTVSMSLTRDDKTTARSIAMAASVGSINFSVRLGF
ncbi:phage tail protein [Rhizobium sp. SSA_523]|uniref:phage tail protein n=1 Tax=Rhizobium sp. SSA_523 TaxID=2952477 RepID=UPI0020916DAD|nr:phage tail protein [Rhizobium sp. SSA_523]MCO5730068.1 phage tail protein [Rhizobium sp. SSA_523]WKC25134.1 phage tail protein [Rhizobium sp. SSA_523]